MRKLYLLGLIALAGIIIGFAWAEEITLTTYYPAPYGVYKEFTTTSKTCLATNPSGTDANANVGIGTTSPMAKLEVKDGGIFLNSSKQFGGKYPNSTDTSNALVFPKSPTGHDAFQIFRQDPGPGRDTYCGQIGDVTGCLIFNMIDRNVAPVNAHILFGTTLREAFTPVMIIRGDTGNVGIGTTKPQAKLDVNSGNSTVNNGIRIGSVPDAQCTFNSAGTMRYNNGAMEYCDGSKWTGLGGGGVFGSWELKDKNIVYQATSDGFVSVMAYGAGGNYDAWIGGYTDSSNPPNTLRTASLARDTPMRYGITMPVKKGDYWRVVINVGEGTTAGYSVNWLPMGE